MTKHLVVGPFRQVVTMHGLPEAGHLSDDLLPLHEEECGILIEEGRIVEIAPYDQLEADHSEIMELSEPSIALPGFIDAHTHICWAGSRSHDYQLRLQGATYQQIAAAGGGILDTVRHVRDASLEQLTEATLLHAEQLLARGITTCEVKSGYGLTVADELKMLEAIAAANQQTPLDLISTCLAAHTVPPEFDDADKYLDYLLAKLLPLVKERCLATRVDIFVESGAFTVDQARRYLAAAMEMGFDITVHADQFTGGGAALAGELNALSADHLEASTDDDLRALAEGGVIPIVLPGCSLGLGIPFAPAHRILDYNLPLVIASDWNPGSAPMGDLLTQAAILSAAEKLTMAETLAGVTTRAARALALPDRGILEPGRRADITIFPCADYREILYKQGALRPSVVIVGGETKVIP